MRGSYHPSPPASLEPAVAVLVARSRDCVAQALQGVMLDSPAIRLCLFPNNDEERNLDLGNVALGLERDRAKLVGGEAWNPTRYSHIALNEFDDPRTEPGFAAAGAALLEWADEVRLADPGIWLLEEVAAVLTREPPIEPVADDYVCWVFNEWQDLDESLSWIGAHAKS